MATPTEDLSGQSRRHTIVIWSVLLALLAGAFGLTVLALNSTVFSAGGFVGSYLSALQRHDVDELLATPGVVGAAGAEKTLLVPSALGALDKVTLVSDDDEGAGLHTVTYEYELGGIAQRSTFLVQSEGTRLGPFAAWSFVQSPISELRVTPLHDAAFSVNGVNVRSASGANNQVAYQVFTPGLYVVEHSSTYLTASPVTVPVTAPASVTPVTVEVRASEQFVTQVQKEVDAFLDECTQQKVLFPTGCPFGHELSNRVESAPAWSMASYPVVTIEPGSEPGTWVVPGAQGAAHLTVEVRSLFDGTLSTFDEDVPFSLHWVITLNGTKVDIQALD